MRNPRLDQLDDYPFDRLRALLADIAPLAGTAPQVLSVGEPRHPPPAWLAATLAAHAGDWGRYPPIEGTALLRQAICRWLERRFSIAGLGLDPDRHVLPVAGTREGLYLIASVAVPETKGGGRPVVVLPNPFYHVYQGAAVMAGAEAVYLSATPENDWRPSLASLGEDVLARTALIYLCSPGNPHGAALDVDALTEAIAIARTHDAVLVVDECYTEIWDRRAPAGVLQACAALGDGTANVLACHSLSKRSNVPGLRSGFVAGDPDLIESFRRLRAYAAATLPLPVMAASAALWDDDTHVEANRALYRRKFDAAQAVLGDRFAVRRPDGGFFLWLAVGDDESAARRLWREAAIRVLPGRYLARPDATGVNPGAGFLRIALIDAPAATEGALLRLAEIL